MSHTILTNSLGKNGLQQAFTQIKAGRSLIDAIQVGIQVVEADPTVPHVGVGSMPNMLGELETDAGICDGDTRNIGTVGALKGFLHPIAVARAVMDQLPHTMLVGEGAIRFANEINATPVTEQPEFVTQEWEQWRRERLSQDALEQWPNVPLRHLAFPQPPEENQRDTVIYLAADGCGSCAAGTSTSGWGYKYPGRIGDSPIHGAGFYADSRFGACACTHTGEVTMRAGTARYVVSCMEHGLSVEAACYKGIEDLRSLRDGHLGPVVIYAMDRLGQHFVVKNFEEPAQYCLCRDFGSEIVEFEAVYVTL